MLFAQRGRGQKALQSVFEVASKTGDAANLEGGFDKALVQVMKEWGARSSFDPFEASDRVNVSPAAVALAEFTANTELKLTENERVAGLARLSDLFLSLIDRTPTKTLCHDDVVKFSGFERDALLEVSEAIMAKSPGWDSRRPFSLHDVDAVLQEFGANMRAVAANHGNQNRVLDERELQQLEGKGLEVARYINLSK